MKKLLILFFVFTPPVQAFDFEGGSLHIPAGFEGPITQDLNGQGNVYAFKRPHKDTSAALLQISVFDPGQKFPELSQEEMKEAASQYLLQFLGGVERRRTNFQRGPVQFLRIGGLPLAKISWNGDHNQQRLEGVMYCYIFKSRIVNLHTQDYSKYNRQYIEQAVRAFESMHIAR